VAQRMSESVLSTFPHLFPGKLNTKSLPGCCLNVCALRLPLEVPIFVFFMAACVTLGYVVAVLNARGYMIADFA
jgi:hypothetical protein